MEVFKKLLLLLLIIPNLGFAEKYDSQYYKDWIEGECINQSSYAQNDFIAKKIYKRCEKATEKCIALAKKSLGQYRYKKCMQDETGKKVSTSPKF